MWADAMIINTLFLFGPKIVWLLRKNTQHSYFSKPFITLVFHNSPTIIAVITVIFCSFLTVLGASLGASGYRTNSQFSYVDGIPADVWYRDVPRPREQRRYEGPRYYVLQRQIDPMEPVRWRRFTSSPNPNCTSEVVIPVSDDAQLQ